MEKKRCKECDEPIAGRSDKKFCGDPCRNAHNNRVNSEHTAYMRRVNTILRRNRRILEELSPDEAGQVPLQKMIDSGFNFFYHTSKSHLPPGQAYTFCYEYGYASLDNHLCQITRRDLK